MYTHTHTLQSHFAVNLKLTLHCQLTIFQLKKIDVWTCGTNSLSGIHGVYVQIRVN